MAFGVITVTKRRFEIRVVEYKEAIYIASGNTIAEARKDLDEFLDEKYDNSKEEKANGSTGNKQPVKAF